MYSMALSTVAALELPPLPPTPDARLGCGSRRAARGRAALLQIVLAGASSLPLPGPGDTEPACSAAGDVAVALPSADLGSRRNIPAGPG